MYTTLNKGKDTENEGKERENPKNLVNDKKRSSEILAVKMDFFPKNCHSEILVREKCFRSPQTRRQVESLKGRGVKLVLNHGSGYKTSIFRGKFLKNVDF